MLEIFYLVFFRVVECFFLVEFGSLELGMEMVYCWVDYKVERFYGLNVIEG